MKAGFSPLKDEIRAMETEVLKEFKGFLWVMETGIEQRSKPWLVVLCEDYTTCLYGDCNMPI